MVSLNRVFLVLLNVIFSISTKWAIELQKMANILLYTIVNWISLCFGLFGEKKTFEDVTLEFRELLRAFFIIFWHFVN